MIVHGDVGNLRVNICLQLHEGDDEGVYARSRVGSRLPDRDDALRNRLLVGHHREKVATGRLHQLEGLRQRAGRIESLQIGSESLSHAHHDENDVRGRFAGEGLVIPCRKQHTPLGEERQQVSCDLSIC